MVLWLNFVNSKNLDKCSSKCKLVHYILYQFDFLQLYECTTYLCINKIENSLSAPTVVSMNISKNDSLMYSGHTIAR